MDSNSKDKYHPIYQKIYSYCKLLSSDRLTLVPINSSVEDLELIYELLTNMKTLKYLPKSWNLNVVPNSNTCKIATAKKWLTHRINEWFFLFRVIDGHHQSIGLIGFNPIKKSTWVQYENSNNIINVNIEGSSRHSPQNEPLDPSYLDFERLELGYLFLSSSWGNGYASECLARLIKFLSIYYVSSLSADFNDLKLKQLVATSLSTNTKSHNVLLKNGFETMERNHESGLKNDENNIIIFIRS